MKIKDSQDLKLLNTFGLSVVAKNLIPIYSENDIFEALVAGFSPIKILGGGSNILLTKDVNGYLLHCQIKGIQIIDEDENQVLIEVGAGEFWHNLVLWSISQNLGGLENLSLIPGSVGAAPMQNIGAYGVEQKESFHSLTAILLTKGIRKTFYNEDCRFGYRESIFKNECKDQYFITRVRYLLNKKNHKLNISYGAIQDILSSNNITNPSIKDVSNAIIEIRSSKLPNPNVIGNAGSFFKNPVIDLSSFTELQKIYPNMPYYENGDGRIKIPAGWLIEQAGFKGRNDGKIGVHKDQALVLVNFGQGHGKDIYALALEIKDVVLDKFKIDIHPEVNIW